MENKFYLPKKNDKPILVMLIISCLFFCLTTTNILAQPCITPPTANAGTNSSVCAGGVYTLAGTIGGSASSAIWSSSGTGSFSPSDVYGVATTYIPSGADVTAGSVTLTLTTDDPDGVGDCMPAVSSLVLTINALPAQPVITPSGATTFCSPGSVDLTSGYATGNVWSPGGAVTQTITVTSSASYTVTYTDLNGCSATSLPTAVTVNSGTATITPSGPTTFCAGGSVVLTANSSSSYIWSTTETTQGITVLSSGSYSVTTTDGNGCTASASQVVVVNALPSVSITGSNVICSTGISNTLTANATAGSGTISSYQWVLNGTTNVGTNTTYTTSVVGSYTVKVTNSNGCFITSSSFVLSANNAPLSGTYTINSSLAASCTNYLSFANAIADLNSRGVSGNVIFNVNAGHIEVAPTAGLSINMCGLSSLIKPNASQTVTFQKSGAGANPKINSGTGSGTTDLIFSLVGADYITIDRIDLGESAGNTTAVTMMEFGYVLVPCNGTDGAQNNIIKNCTVTLNKLNTNVPVGIAILNNGITTTALSGTNSYNKIYSNTITNVYIGIYCIGYGDVSPFSFYDQANEIGAVGQGNTITNFGNGGSGATSVAYGVYSVYNNDILIKGNTINNSGGAAHVSSIRGIAVDQAMNANTTVENNTITVSTSTTGTNTCYAILNFSGSRTSRSNGVTNSVNINNNTITNCSYPSTGTGAYYSVWNAGSWTTSATDSLSAYTLNINNNIITNNNSGSNTTSSVAYAQVICQSAVNFLNINGNTITGNNYTGINTATNRAIVTGMGLNSISSWVQVTNIQNNTIQNNNSNTSTTTGGGTISNIDCETYGTLSGGAAVGSQYNVTGNTLGNVTQTIALSGTYRGVTTSANTNIAVNISNNKLSNVTRNSMTGSLTGFTATGANPASVTMNADTISTISNLGGTTDAFTGVNSTGGAATVITLSNNKISGINVLATGGIFNGVTSTSTTSPTVNLVGNKVSSCTLSSVTTGAFNGVINAGSTSVTNLTMTEDTVQGITHNGTGTMQCLMAGNALTFNVSNNRILTNTKTTATSGDMYGINSTGSGTLTTNMTFAGNVINGNIHQGTGSFYGFYAQLSLLYNLTGNTVSNNQHTGASGTMFCSRASGAAGSTVNYSGNTITNNSAPTTSGATATTIYGFYNFGSPGTAENYTGNSINNLSMAGSSTATTNVIYGMYTNTAAASSKTISGNTINGLSTTAGLSATIHGIYTALGTTNSFTKNKIYGLSAGGSSGVVHGINLISGITNNVTNNIVGELNADFSTNATAISNLTIAGGTTANVYYNTFWISTVSGSTTAFGTSNIYASSATPTVTLRNNILINRSNPGGIGGANGAAVCFRRPAAIGMTASYGTASNNNIFYAGSPDANHLFYVEGTTAGATGKSSISALQAYATGRETFSQTENVAFTSTTGSNAQFLHVNTAIATLAESGAVNISGITDDFDANVRQGNPGYTGTGTAPDIGADEFNGASPAPIISPVTVTPSGSRCTSTTSRAVNATVTTPSGTITSVTLNYSFNGTAQLPITMTFVSGNQYTATIPASTPVNATVTWTISAVNSLALTGVYSGPTYKDNYLANVTTTATVSPSTVCNGTPATLTVTSIDAAAGFATIGTSTTTISTTGNPYRTGAGVGLDIKTQLLIRSSELTASGLIAGNINSLGFNVTSTTGSFNNFTIKMGHTALTLLSTTYVTTPMTSVFSNASTYTPVVGVNTHTFSTPFVWDGVSNVIIEICQTNTVGGTNTMSAIVPGYNADIYSAATGACTAVTGTIFANRPVVILGGLVGTSFTSTFTYTWNPGSVTGSSVAVTPSTTTTYTASGIDVNGCTVTSNPITLTVNPVPAAPTGTNSSQCGTGTPTASVTGTGGTFKWYLAPSGGTALAGQTGNTLVSYPISSTTTFYVSEVLTGCEGQRSMVIVNVSNPDPVNAFSSVATTCPFTNFDLSATQTGSTNSYVYSWSATPVSGSGIPTSVGGNPATIQATAGGTYIYMVTATDAGAGCVATATISVTITNPPSISSATASPSSFCNGGTTTLTALTSTAVAGTATIGTQTATIGGNTGNPYRTSAAVQFRIQLLYTAAEMNAAGFSTGPITSLGFTVVTGAAGSLSNYTISMGHTNATVLSTSFITSSVSQVFTQASFTPVLGLNTHIFNTPFNWDGVSNILINICSDPLTTGTTTVATFTPAALSNVQATGASSCTVATGTTAATKPIITLGGMIGGFGSGSFTWTWNPGNLSGNIQTVSPTTSTVYTVQAYSSVSGCSNFVSVPVIVNPVPVAPQNNDGAQCGFGVPNCTVSGNGGTFRWYLNPTGGTALPGETLDHLVSYSISSSQFFYVSEFNGQCEGPRVAVYEDVFSPDAIVAHSSTPTCLNELVNLTVTKAVGSNNYSYNWTASPQAGSGLSGITAGNPIDGHLDVTPTTAGTYTYTVDGYDANTLCAAQSSVTITVTDHPSITSVSANPTTICQGSNVTLTALTGSTSQAIANIGTQTTTLGAVTGNPLRTSAGLPWRIQLLVLGSELSAQGLVAGPLYRLGFTATAAVGTFASYSIDLAQTSATSLTTTYLTTSLTNVYNQVTTYTPVVGLNNFVFSSPFNWNGTSNILINICTVNGTTGTTTVAAWTPGYASNVQGTGAGACTALTGTAATLKPTISFLGTASTSGPGSYSWTWNPGNLNGNVQTASPNASTTYTVTATNPASGCTSTGTVSVTTIPLPSAPSATTSTQCGAGIPTATATGTGGLLRWYNAPSGGTPISGESGSQLTITSISSTTTFYVSEFDGICEGSRAMVIANVTQPDALTASATSPSCGNSPITLSVLQTGTTNTYAISWTANPFTGSGISSSTPGDPTDGHLIVTPTLGGNYVYTVTGIDAGAGCTSIGTVSVTVTAPPLITSASASPDPVCAGSSVTLTALTGVPGGSSFHEGFETFPGAFVAGGTGTTWAQSAVYYQEDLKSAFATYAVSANGFLSMTSDINLTGLTGPKLEFYHICGTEALFDYGHVDYSLNGGTTWIPFPVADYLGTGVIETVDFPGEIHWSRASYTNWSSQFTSSASTYPAGPATALWQHESINLSAYSSASTFRIRFRLTSDASVLYAGWAIDNVRITTTSSSGAGAYNWQWAPGGLPAGNTAVVNPLATTTYTVTATDPISNCTSSATVSVTVNPIPATPTASSSTQCGSGTPACSVSGSGGAFKWYLVPTGGTAIAGQNGSQLAAYNILSTTTFYVSEFDGACESNRVMVIANVNQPDAIIAFSSPNPVCGNSTLNLTVSQTGNVNTYSYSWSASPSAGSGLLAPTAGDPVDGHLNVIPTTGGTYVYTVTASDIANSCQTISTVSVTVNNPPSTPVPTAAPASVCLGSTSQLNAGTYISGNGTLTTPTTVGNSSSASGFDVTNISALPITLHFFSFTSSATAGTALTESVYYNTTPMNCVFPTNVTTAPGWTLIGSASTTSAGTAPNLTTIPLNVNITIPPGATYAFALGGASVAYTTGTSGCPVINADANLSVKEGFGGTLTATIAARRWNGSVSYSYQIGNPSLTYSWTPTGTLNNPAIINPVATPTAQTTYTIVATDPTSNCTSSGTVTVNISGISSLPVANANPSVICISGTTTLSVTSPDAGVTYTWESSPSGISGTWTPIGNGSTITSGTLTTDTYFHVIATCGLAVETSASILVTVANPNITSTNGATRCGPGIVNLSVTGTGNFDWYLTSSGGTPEATNTSTYSPIVGSNTIYWVQAYVGSCLDPTGRHFVSVTVTPSPSISVVASPGTSICSGDMITLTASSSNDPNYTYSWSTDGSTIIATGSVYTSSPTSNTTYYAYAVDNTAGTNAGCASLAVTTVVVNPSPASPVIVPANASVCTPGQQVTLAVSNPDLSGSTNYSWMPGNLSGPSITVSPTSATLYTVTATSVNLAGNNVGVLATVTSSGGGASTAGYGPELLNDNNIVACDATGTFIWGWVTTGGSYTFTWNSPQTFNKIKFFKSNRPFSSIGTIEYSTNGGASFTTLVSGFAGTSTCTGGVVNSSVDSVTFSSVTGNVLRFTGIAGSNPNFREIQVLSPSFSGGCSRTATSLVSYDPISAPTITSVGSTTICPGGNVLLDAGAGYTNYSWSDGVGVVATTQTYNASPASTTTYTVTVDNGGVCSATASVTVTVAPLAPPTITSSNGTTFCSSGSTSLDAGSYASWLWSTTATTQSISANSSGTYTVTVTATNGCTASSSIVLTVNPTPSTAIALPSGPIDICDNGSNSPVSLIADTTGAGFGATIAWNDIGGGTDNTLLVDNNSLDLLINGNTFQYGFTVTNNGCSTNSNLVTVNIVTCNTSVTLNATMYLEGFYAASNTGLMDNYGAGGCLFLNGSSTNPLDADTVEISMMDAVTYALVDAQKGILKVNGTVSVTFGPSVTAGTSYYIRVKHRNAVQTWSANPVLAAAVTSYDFSTSQTQAYGSNLVQTSDMLYWAFYSGDISDAGSASVGLQDEVIESQDYSDMENAVFVTLTGYVGEDITGDIVVESLDYSIMENNVFFVIFSQHP